MPFITLLVVAAVCALAAIVFLHRWALEEAGVDLDTDSMNLRDVKRLGAQRQLILLALSVPCVIFLLICMAYVLGLI